MSESIFDRNYGDWKPGDQIVWEEEKMREASTILLRIDEYERVFWMEGEEECMTRATNMLRAKSQILTYTRFLECLDKARGEMRQVHCAAVNKKTFMDLMNDMDARHIPVNGPVHIYGIPIEVDESLPDNAIKIDDRAYNTEERKG
jgi:hypothetical protein